MKWLTKIAWTFVAITGLLFLCYLGLILYINWPNDRILAKNIELTTEWIEVAIEPAVKPENRSQSINMRIRDLKLPDGKSLSPELELYDDSGNKVEFYHSGSVSKYFVDEVFRAGYQKQPIDLPVDRRYTKLRIRSDFPFSCDQIYWRDYDPK